MTLSTKWPRLGPGLMLVFATMSFATAVTACAAESADVASGKEIAANGGGNGVTACGTCHGANGEGQAAKASPRLAGLDAAYMNAQLAAFGSGTRDHEKMGPIAKKMDPHAISATGTYYASLSAPPAPAAASTSPLRAAGEAIALRGDWSANIPPCASCHGLRGLGVGTVFPPVAGQPAEYIANQLKAWKSGKRRNDPHGLMRTASIRLNNEQIAAVAAYYESLTGAHPAQHGPEAKP